MSAIKLDSSALQRKDYAQTATPHNSTEYLATSNDEKVLPLNHLPDTMLSSTDAIVDDTANHIHGVPLALTLIALSSAVFCVALDMTIIATAIPRITDEFHALQDIGWYGSAYLLTTCGECESIASPDSKLLTRTPHQHSNSPSAKSTAYSILNGYSCGHCSCLKLAPHCVAPRLHP